MPIPVTEVPEVGLRDTLRLTPGSTFEYALKIRSAGELYVRLVGRTNRGREVLVDLDRSGGLIGLQVELEPMLDVVPDAVRRAYRARIDKQARVEIFKGSPSRKSSRGGT